MAKVFHLQSWDTGLYADCVEFCPLEPYLSFFVCGTYQLCESNATRIGRLTLHSLTPEVDLVVDLLPVQLLDGCGILDVKWCRKTINDRVVLASANALGQTTLFGFHSDSWLSEYHVKSIGDSRLALFCDWCGGGDKIAVSDSTGSVSVLNVSGNSSDLLSSWKCHDYEAWVTTFDRHSDHMVYSGGDDSCFKLWDLRDLNSPALTNRKAHQMGVTSIETSPIDCNLLVTGSYDERLLLWDKRQMKTWKSETNLGGGVWRVKWEPDSGRYLLVAAMHNGFHILDCNGSVNVINPSDPDRCTPQPQVIASYKEHSNLAYGCDWSRQRSPSPRKTIASCSFYDHCLQVWTWEP